MLINFKGIDLICDYNIIEGEEGVWRDSNGTGTPDIGDGIELNYIDYTDDRGATADILPLIIELNLEEEIKELIEIKLTQ